MDDRPTIGVVDAATHAADMPGGSAVPALRMAVAVAELRRRLTGFALRFYGLVPDTLVSELAEQEVQPLGPWHPGRPAELRDEVDGIIVLAGSNIDGHAAAVLAELEQAGIPIHYFQSGQRQADPLVLVGRLADDDLLDRRREYLALTGQAPREDPYVLSLAPSTAGAALRETVAAGRRVVRPEGPLGAVDLMALVYSAEAVVTTSAEMRLLADVLGRPVVTRLSELDSSDRPSEAPVKKSERLADLVAHADQLFDCAGQTVLQHVEIRERPRNGSEQLASLERRVAALEVVNAGLRRTLARERTLMATELRRRASDETGPYSAWSAFNVERTARELGAAQAHMARLQAEIDALNSTRTMRALAPVRRVYGMVRRIVPSSSERLAQ